MALPTFEYCKATSVAEAMRLWAEVPSARYLAGGTDLLPQLRLGRHKAERVVDIKAIDDLKGITVAPDGRIVIGAAATLADIVGHPDVRRRFPMLVDCCQEVGAYALRHRATMAGNLCNASPAADTAVGLLALDAEVLAYGPAGERTIALGSFFAGPGRSVLRPGELLAAIRLPAGEGIWSGRYLRLSRRKGMDLASVGVLAAMAPLGLQPRYRIALAAVAPTPMRVAEAETLLDHEGLSARRRAAELAAAACRPISDVRASAEYRREMVRVLVLRALDEMVANRGAKP